MGLCPSTFLRHGQMLLADLQTAVAAVPGIVAGQQHTVYARWCSNAIIRVGLLRMKIKRKQQVGPLKYDNLVVVVFIQQMQVVAVQQVVRSGHLDHITVKAGQKLVF